MLNRWRILLSLDYGKNWTPDNSNEEELSAIRELVSEGLLVNWWGNTYDLTDAGFAARDKEIARRYALLMYRMTTPMREWYKP